MRLDVADAGVHQFALVLVEPRDRDGGAPGAHHRHMTAPQRLGRIELWQFVQDRDGTRRSCRRLRAVAQTVDHGDPAALVSTPTCATPVDGVRVAVHTLTWERAAGY